MYNWNAISRGQEKVNRMREDFVSVMRRLGAVYDDHGGRYEPNGTFIGRAWVDPGRLELVIFVNHGRVQFGVIEGNNPMYTVANPPTWPATLRKIQKNLGNILFVGLHILARNEKAVSKTRLMMRELENEGSSFWRRKIF